MEPAHTASSHGAAAAQQARHEALRAARRRVVARLRERLRCSVRAVFSRPNPAPSQQQQQQDFAQLWTDSEAAEAAAAAWDAAVRSPARPQVRAAAGSAALSGLRLWRARRTAPPRTRATWSPARSSMRRRLCRCAASGRSGQRSAILSPGPYPRTGSARSQSRARRSAPDGARRGASQAHGGGAGQAKRSAPSLAAAAEAKAPRLLVGSEGAAAERWLPHRAAAGDGAAARPPAGAPAAVAFGGAAVQTALRTVAGFDSDVARELLRAPEAATLLLGSDSGVGAADGAPGRVAFMLTVPGSRCAALAAGMACVGLPHTLIVSDSRPSNADSPATTFVHLERCSSVARFVVSSLEQNAGGLDWKARVFLGDKQMGGLPRGSTQQYYSMKAETKKVTEDIQSLDVTVTSTTKAKGNVVTKSLVMRVTAPPPHGGSGALAHAAAPAAAPQLQPAAQPQKPKVTLLFAPAPAAARVPAPLRPQPQPTAQPQPQKKTSLQSGPASAPPPPRAVAPTLPQLAAKSTALLSEAQACANAACTAECKCSSAAPGGPFVPLPQAGRGAQHHAGADGIHGSGTAPAAAMRRPAAAPRASVPAPSDDAGDDEAADGGAAEEDVIFDAVHAAAAAWDAGLTEPQGVLPKSLR